MVSGSQATAPSQLVWDAKATLGSDTPVAVQAVAEAALDLGRPTVLLEVNGCAFTIAPEAGLSPLCRRLAQERVTYLSSAPDGIVVISNRAADASLRALTEQLIHDGHRVLIVGPTPVLPSWQPDRCSTLRVLRGSCDATGPLSDVTRHQAEAKVLVAQAGAVPGAAVVDLSREICPDGTCRAWREGAVVFRDADHLTVSGNRALVTPVRVALERLSARA